jgi:hypothetical protein
MEFQHSARRLRLTTDHASSVVTVRSSKYGAPASKALSSRLRKYCTDTSCPAAHARTALPPAFSFE